MFFVVDEASGVADPILDAIGGTLTGANNRLLYCGNPTKATGGFAESFQGDGMDWYCMTVSSRDSPRTSKENIAALEEVRQKFQRGACPFGRPAAGRRQ